MGIWTLAADESGKFDTGESHAFLVGGVLLPGAADQVEDLKEPLQAWCAKNRTPYPPHATTLRQAGKWNVTEELVGLSARWLAKHQGFFVGVLCKRGATEADAALHARMLGAFIDLSSRIAAANGATALDLRPASRSFFLKEKERAETARQAGLLVEQRRQGNFFHGVLGTEAREALDALARSAHGRLPAWPLVHSVSVVTAGSAAVHPGVLASDYFCNRTYTATREKATTTRHELTAPSAGASSSVLVVDYHLLSLVRSVDEALRHEPPNLHQLGVALAKLEIARRTFKADGERLFLGVEGAGLVAALLLGEGEKRLIAACQEDKNLALSIAQRLAGDAQSELELKHGDYDGTATALRLGFSGETPLAQMIRAIPDRELVARLYRLSLECCNHTGDSAGSAAASAGFASTLAAGASLALLGEALKVANLNNVALQNELPCPAEDAPPLLLKLTENATQLQELSRQLSHPFLQHAVHSTPGAQALDEHERALRELSGFSNGWTRNDREHGRCLGTAARSLAFAGDLDAARNLALEARGFFADSPFDLAFNAAVLTRIELERARTTPHTTNAPLVRLLLKLSGAEPLRDPVRLDAALKTDPAARFAFDLLLRQLLWAPQISEPVTDQPVIDLLALGQQSSVYQTLRTISSHPSEMIARHTAELLRRQQRKAKMVARWFELALELTASSAMPTLKRLSLFTRHVAEGGVAAGPPGSVLNPSFEYR
jgi:hypothetical protein